MMAKTGPMLGFTDSFQSSLFERSEAYGLYLHIYTKYSSISDISAISMDPLSAPALNLQEMKNGHLFDA